MEQKTAEYTLMKSPFTYLISYFSVDSVLLHSYQNNSSALTVSDTQRPDNSWIEDHSAPISPPPHTHTLMEKWRRMKRRDMFLS